MPVAGWLAYLTLTSAVLDVVVGRVVHAPIVFKDELIYTRLARQIAADPVHGLSTVARSGYGLVYPLLIAPAYVLFHDPPTAYAVCKVINVALWSSSAVPCYFLARRLLPQGWSVAAAGSTVLGPQAIFTALLMTENVFMPVFLWVGLAAVRALEAPSRGRQTVVGLALFVAVVTRLQAVALVPGFVIAAACLGRGSLRAQRSLIAWLVAPPAVLLALEIARRHGLSSALGAYGVLSQGYSPLRTLEWAVMNLADLDVLLGFVLFAAVPVAIRRGLRGPDATAGSRALAAVLVGFGFPTVLMVAMFSASGEGQHRVHERYLLYLVPLVVILTLWVLRRGASLRELAPWLLVAAALPVALPLRHTASQSWVDSFAVQPWLNELMPAAYAHAGLILAGIAVLSAAAWVVAARFGRTLVVLGVAAFALSSFFALSAVRGQAAKYGRFRVARADWVDRAAGGRTVAAVYRSNPCATVHRAEQGWIALWRAEALNDTVSMDYHVRSPLPGGSESHKLALGRGGLLLDQGVPVRVRYALVDDGLRVRGQVVAQAPAQGLRLIRLAGPLRVAGVQSAGRCGA